MISLGQRNAVLEQRLSLAGPPVVQGTRATTLQWLTWAGEGTPTCQVPVKES